jgi:hypothetical protein
MSTIHRILRSLSRLTHGSLSGCTKNSAGRLRAVYAILSYKSLLNQFLNNINKMAKWQYKLFHNIFSKTLNDFQQQGAYSLFCIYNRLLTF